MKLIERPPYKPKMAKGKKITQPARYVSTKEALSMYRANTLEQKMIAHWDSEGIEMPDLQMMNKIQKLELLNDYRDSVVKSRQKLREIDQKSAETFKKQKEDEQRANEQRNASQLLNTGKNGGESSPDKQGK